MMAGMDKGIAFAKGHGTGNDFVILPDPDGDAVPLTPALVAAVCDRRRGLGADGVLRVVRTDAHPEATGPAEWFMDYWNADGSVAEMCGNGVRVYARYLVESGLAGVGELSVGTRAGVVRAVVGEEISVAMPIPRLYGESTATLAGREFPGVAVDVGNPHLVCAAEDILALDLRDPPGFDDVVFAAGVNVEFVAPAEDPVPEVDLHVRMRVHERGSGETLSCGSGACAVAAVALRRLGRDTGSVAVDVLGGRLTVRLDGGECWLTGPALVVASGRVSLDALLLTTEQMVGASRSAFAGR
jgi:diaminopimelate epimerase